MVLSFNLIINRNFNKIKNFFLFALFESAQKLIFFQTIKKWEIPKAN